MSATLTGTGWLVDQIPAPVRSLPPVTWANLPPAAANSGLVTRVTDVGVAPGIEVVSDGTRWVPIGAQCLARAAVAASVTGTLVETALATVSLPAGAMGVNGGIEVRSSWSVTNSANNKTIRVRLGGPAGSQHLNLPITTTNSFADLRHIRNRNSAASQVGSASASAGGVSGSTTVAAALSTSAVDTSAAQDLVISGQLALGTETISLESYEVWLLP